MKITTTPAQIAANQANALHSTGPQSDEGKAASSRNNLRHGLAGAFSVLDWEDEDAFARLHTRLLCEHAPEGTTELILVDNMIRHQWLLQRAFRLQEDCFHSVTGECHDPNRLALYIRYQTTNERAFFKCLHELQRLQTARRKLAESQDLEKIGFESQKRKAEGQEIRLELLKLKLATAKTAAAGRLEPSNTQQDLVQTAPSLAANANSIACGQSGPSL